VSRGWAACLGKIYQGKLLPELPEGRIWEKCSLSEEGGDVLGGRERLLRRAVYFRGGVENYSARTS